jgi:hypothetical protein
MGQKVFLFVLGISCFTSWKSFAQVDSVTVEKVSIINAKHKVEGIYKTFDEFRRNQPSYTDKFSVIPARDVTGSVNKAKKLFSITNRALDYVDHIALDGKEKPIRNGFSGQRFFGYCKNGIAFIGFWRFHRIDELGHLSLIRVVEYRYHQGANSSVPGAGGVMTFNHSSVGMETLFKKWFILDYMTGELYAINTFSLLDKFELWDKELRKEYRKTKNRNKLEIQLQFVRKFNKRNPIRF